MCIRRHGSPRESSKLTNFIFSVFFWVRGTFGTVPTSIVSDSRVGKRLGARDMSIFGFHVGPHISNIEYIEAYEVIWGYLGVSGGPAF